MESFRCAGSNTRLLLPLALGVLLVAGNLLGCGDSTGIEKRDVEGIWVAQTSAGTMWLSIGRGGNRIQGSVSMEDEQGERVRWSYTGCLKDDAVDLGWYNGEGDGQGIMAAWGHFSGNLVEEQSDEGRAVLLQGYLSGYFCFSSPQCHLFEYPADYVTFSREVS